MTRALALVALGLDPPMVGIQFMDEASGGARGALAPPTAADSVELLVFFF
jgi:hypothetical protein